MWCCTLYGIKKDRAVEQELQRERERRHKRKKKKQPNILGAFITKKNSAEKGGGGDEGADLAQIWSR